MTSGQRLFGTKIRRAAAQGPNFAGRFAVAQWGCGIGCLSMAVIDAKTGQVYAAPFDLLRIPIDLDDPLSFRLTSRLLIVRGCPEETDCASYFYEWQGPHWKLVSSVPEPLAKLAVPCGNLPVVGRPLVSPSGPRASVVGEGL